MPSQVRSSGTAPSRSRAEWHAQMKALRDEGMTGTAIARLLGCASSFVYDVLNDPTGERVKARKASYGGRCETCGDRTDGSNGSGKAPRFCHPCSARACAKWDRDRVIAAIQEYHRMFGVPPTASDFQPSLARRCSAERYAEACARHAAGDWPALGTVQQYCGSWNQALADAGFPVYLGLRRIDPAAA